MAIFDDFNTWVQQTATEVVDQQTALWNEATRGAIQLVSGMSTGDFAERSSYALLTGLYGNRDPSSSAALAATPLSILKDKAVKVGMGSLPMEYRGSEFDWTQRPVEEAGVAFGTQVGAAKFQYMLNSTLAALVGAIDNNGLTYDGTAATMNLKALNQGAGQFGDRRGAIRTWVGHSKVMTDMFDYAIDNSNRLFEFENIAVMTDGHGRILVETDSPALFFDNAGTDNYYTIGLVEGGAVVQDNGDSRVYTETKTEFVNARELIKEESSFNLALKGYTYGGAGKPDDAALALGANWTKVVTSDKDTAGVLVQTL